MKRILLFILLSFATLSFANTYTISKFSAEDVGSPDSHIQAEFGGELKTASPTAVLDIQKGRLFIRQKFEDPFGEEATVYQIYQGRAGDMSSLKALQPPSNVSYAKLLNLKLYTSSSSDASSDIEKVYFDGKSVYVEDATAFVSVNGSMVELKPASAESAQAVAVPAPETPAIASSSYGEDEYEEEEEEEAVAPAPPVKEKPIAEAKPIVPPKLYEEEEEDDDEYVAAGDEEENEECDENDPECEEEEEYDVTGDVSSTNSTADAMDYSASDAATDVTNRFGIADEVRFWSGVALAAVAAGSAVAGVLQHMKANEARQAYDDLSSLKKSFLTEIKSQCSASSDPGKCETAMIWDLSNNGFPVNGTNYTLTQLNERISVNEDTMNSYTLFRNVWFGVTAVSLTASIVLFVW